MSQLNSIENRADEARIWRRDIHQHPELGYDVTRTAAKVADLLGSFGLDDIATGIGRTGVVGVIKGRRGPGRTIGLRAEMDALPITEATGLEHASSNPGVMHACGHDGHTATLLAAAKYLAETRDFAGTVVVIFQPAEEGGAGGQAMLDDGLFERFPVDEIYGMHNMPGIPAGDFATCAGPMMAAVDHFDIVVEGRGGHAAWPHLSIDPIVIAGHILVALQTIVARRLDPVDTAVLTVTKINAGTAYNVIPSSAALAGTVRTLTPAARDLMERELTAIATQTAEAHGANARVEYERGYPATITDPEKTEVVAAAARSIVGESRVDVAMKPLMGGEDFAYMLARKPGGYVFIGNGDSTGLHTDTYDFNDDIIAVGLRYWIELVQHAIREA